MTRLVRYVSMPFLLIPVVLLVVFYGDDAAGEFIDSVTAFFRDL